MPEYAFRDRRGKLHAETTTETSRQCPRGFFYEIPGFRLGFLSTDIFCCRLASPLLVLHLLEEDNSIEGFVACQPCMGHCSHLSNAGFAAAALTILGLSLKGKQLDGGCEAHQLLRTQI